jgi:Fe-S cluster assembly protein SufD
LKLQAVKGVRRLVLVDGVFAPKLSELAGSRRADRPHPARRAGGRRRRAAGAAVDADNANPMVALNSAMMTDGVVIEIANGVVLTQPLQIVHIASGSAPAAMFTRSLLRLGKDAGVTLVESYIAADGATPIRSTTR